MKKIVLGGGGALLLGAFATVWMACVNNSTQNSDTSCGTYCNTMASVCSGNTTQYASLTTCAIMCGVMEAGTPGVGGDNSVACRSIGLSNAKEDPPDSSQLYQDCLTAGVSSAACPADPCTAFCAMDVLLCPSSLTNYANAQECVTACRNWGQDFSGPLIGSTGNTLQCRTYHLELSQTGNMNDLMTHCPHTGVVSARCFDTPDGGNPMDGATDATSE